MRTVPDEIRLAKGATYNILGWLVSTAASIVVTPVLVRGIGAEEYGIYAIVGLLGGYLGSVAAPIAQAGIRRVAFLRGRALTNIADVQQTISASLLIQVMVTAAIGLLCYHYAHALAHEVFKIPDSLLRKAEFTFKIGAITFIISGTSSVLEGIPQAFGRFGVLSTANAGISVVQSVSLILLVVLGYGLEELVIIHLVTASLGLVVFAGIGNKLQPGFPWITRFDVGLVKEITGFGFWVLINQWASLVTFQLGKTIVGIAIGVRELGYYAVATTLALYLQAVGAKVAAVLFPLTAELSSASGPERLRLVYVKSLRAFLFLVGGAAVLTMGWMPLVLRYWIGPEFERNATYAASWLVGWGLWHAMGAIPFAVANGCGRPKINALFGCLFGAANVLGIVLFVNRGIEGIALGSFLSTCLVSPVYIGWIQRHVLGMRAGELFRPVILPFLLAGTGTLAVALRLVNWTVGVGSALLGCLFSGIVYIALGLIFGLISSAELGAVIQRRRWTGEVRGA